MTEVFGSGYSDAYDALYQDKNYLAECDLVERIFAEYGVFSIRKVLDLGCGTGGHAFVLADRGYDVTGVDQSQAMLSRARAKSAESQGSKVSFELGDIRRLELHKTFDAAIMMFAVLGYQTENADVLAALRSARRHVADEGLLVFDVWYGPAVLAQRPSARLKEIAVGKGRIMRFASAEVDFARQVSHVTYDVLRIEEDRVERGTECHQMRYFFPKEIELLLEGTGFMPLKIGAFPNFSDSPNEDSWSVLIAARASAVIRNTSE